jgi:hypothetical protein
LFYNADLIDIPACCDEIASAFVDDTYLAARAPSIEESYERLTNMMTRPGGALDWSRTHNSRFELDKTGLMTFTHRRVLNPARPNKTMPLPRPPIVIDGHSIKSSPSLKFLGVILDQELCFKAQADHVVAKGKF